MLSVDFLNVASLFGGVGLFLYGMTLMSGGLRQAAGDRMRGILERVTQNRVMAVLIGLLVTLLIQSSSATDMMVIGFVDSGLMSLAQAIGVVLGANIGTTVTAQITAFDLTALAPLLVFAGCILYIFMKRHLVKCVGSIVLGFGMLFVGIGLIKSAIAPLADSPAFVQALSALSNPLAAILFGVAFTALLQSSSSAVVIFQAFAVEGLLTYEQSVYLVIGAAIGSTAPNLLASLTTGRQGKRAALLNLMFNLFRAVLLTALTLIFPALTRAIASLSPNNIARQIANTHTIFAIIAVICALPFTSLMIRCVEKLVPELPSEKRARDEHRLRYISAADARMPALAVKQAMLEINRMGHIARDNLNAALEYFFNPGDEQAAKRIEENEATVDYLHKAITEKLIEYRELDLSHRDAFRLSKMLQVSSNYERIGDHAENILEFAQRLKTADVAISEVGTAELKSLSAVVMQTLDKALEVFEGERFELLGEVEYLEDTVDHMQEQYIQNHIDRLMVKSCDPLGGVIFTDMCTDLERCSDQALNIATSLKDLPNVR